MAGFLYKGILLQQHKEPALSRDLREFFNADTVTAHMSRHPVDKPDDLSPDEIIEIAREAHIIDERDGKLLADKLSLYRRHTPQLLVADAIDDEPYISSQINPLLKNQKLTCEGLKLAQRATGVQTAYIAVYKNLTDLDIKVPKVIGDYQVKRIRGRYPAEYQASKTYDSAHAALLIGAGAMIHLARAVLYNKPQTTTFITVAGNCVGNPTNLEVSLGMTVMQVLERCGLINDPGRVIVGGSMTGISVIDTENTLITPTTRAVLAFREDAKELNLNCIGCSRCVHVCPEGLNPFFLYRSVKYKRYQDFRKLDPQMCIGCGTCSYMCPAKLDLSHTIQEGIQEFRHMSGSMRAASVAAAKRETKAFEQYMEDFHIAKAEKAAQRAARREALAEKSKAAEEKVEQAENLGEKLEGFAAVVQAEVETAVVAVSETVDELVSNANEAVAELLQKKTEPVGLDESTAAEEMAEIVGAESEPSLETSEEQVPPSIEPVDQEAVNPAEDENAASVSKKRKNSANGWRKNNKNSNETRGRMK
ncbi:4Fe-4S dicluster domain-containing protein [Oscillospiraceae bacterium PP1C4]